MDRCHCGLLNADSSSHDFHNRRDAVRRAACTRNDLSRVPLESIHRVDHGGNVLAFRRSRQDDEARSSLNVLHEIVSLSKDACTLEHDINAHFAPRQLGRVPFAQNGIILAVNFQALVLRADIPGPSSVYGVEFQQIGEIIGRQHIVNCSQAQSRFF